MKKLISVLSVLGLLVSAVPVLPVNAGEAVIAGDADNSGNVDILDVITVNKAVLGKETLTEDQVKAIDFNGNGKPDSEEALELMKFIIGIVDELKLPADSGEKQIALPKGYILAKSSPVEAENVCSDFETQTIVAIDDFSDVRGYVLPVRDENAPETLETKYAPAWLPEGCAFKEDFLTYRSDENLDLTDFAYTFSKAYTNSKNGIFYFHQTLEEDFHFCYSLTDNAESTSNFTHEVYPITIGEKEGFCYEYTFTSRAVKTPLTSYEIFWKQDGYIMSIEAYAISLEEAIQMAESVAPVQ